jgi:hypothetical protein
VKEVKVTLYTREHGTQRYKKAKKHTVYPPGTTFVLRYLGKWETIECASYGAGYAAALNKQIELFTGKGEPTPRKFKPSDPESLDVVIDNYLVKTASEKNWRKHTLQCYTLGLKLFRQSCKNSDWTMSRATTCWSSKLFSASTAPRRASPTTRAPSCCRFLSPGSWRRSPATRRVRPRRCGSPRPEEKFKHVALVFVGELQVLVDGPSLVLDASRLPQVDHPHVCEKLGPRSKPAREPMSAPYRPTPGIPPWRRR